MKKFLNILIITIIVLASISCDSKTPFDESVADFNNNNNRYKQVDVVLDATYNVTLESTETLPPGIPQTHFEYSILIDYENLIMCKTYTDYPENISVEGMDIVYLAEENQLIELYVDETGLVLHEHVLNIDVKNLESDFAVVADKLAFYIAIPEMEELIIKADGSYEIELPFSDLSIDYLDIAVDIYKTGSNRYCEDCIYIINYDLNEDNFIVTVTAEYEDSEEGIIHLFSISYKTFYPESVNIIEYIR